MQTVIRRTLVALSASFAIGFAAASMTSGPGSAAMVSLSGKAQFAGLYAALLNIGAAAGAALGGRAMDAFGRRPVLIAGHLLSVVGFSVAGLGVAFGLLPAFVTGVLIVALGAGIGGLHRIAAAELFPPAERGRGIAWVQTSAIAGAVAGPLLLVLSEPRGHAIGREPLAIVWWMAPPHAVLGMLVLRRAAEPMEIGKEIERQYPHVPSGPPGSPAPWPA
jgi:MFS family permease